MEMDAEAAPTASNEEEDGLPAGGRSDKGETDSTPAEKRESKSEGPPKPDKDADDTAKLTQSARTTSFEVQQTRKSLERPQDVSQLNKTDDSNSKTSGYSMGSSLGKHSIKSINIAGDFPSKLTMATSEPEKSPKLSSEESAQSPSTKTNVPSSSVPASLPESSSDAPDKPAKVSQPGSNSDSTKSPAVIASQSPGNMPASSVKTPALSSSEASSSSIKSASPSAPTATGLAAKNPAKSPGENISTKQLPASSETKTSGNPSTSVVSTTGVPGKPLVKPEVMSKTSAPSQSTPKFHSSQPSNPSPTSSLKPSLPKTPTAISSPTVSSSTSIKPTVLSTIVTKSTPSIPSSSSSANSNKSVPSSVLPSSSVSSTSKIPQTPLSPYKSVPKIMPSVKPKINPPKFTSLVSSTASQKPSTFQSSSSPSSSSNTQRPSPKPSGLLPARPTATTSIPSLMSIKVTCPSIFSSARTSLQYSSNRSLATSTVQSGSTPTVAPRASLPLSRTPVGSPRPPPAVVGSPSSTQRPSNPTQPQTPTLPSRPLPPSRNPLPQTPQPSPSARDPSLPIPLREAPNRESPVADFSVPDIRRDCPTGPDPPTPTASSVPDVLRTGSEEEDRHLERMLRPTQFGSGIPPPNMPDLCRKGSDAPMGRVPTIALPSAEAGVDLLQPASVASNPIPDLNESVSDRVEPSSTGSVGGQGSSEESMEVTREPNQGTSSVEEMQVVPSVEEAGTSRGASGDAGDSGTAPRAVESLTKGDLPENEANKKVQALKMDVSSPMKGAVTSMGIQKVVEEDGAVSGVVVSSLETTDDKKAVDSVTTDSNLGTSAGGVSCDSSVPVKGENVEENANSDLPLPVEKAIAMEEESPESVGGAEGKPQVQETVPNPMPKDPASDASKGERMTVERAEADKDSLVGEESTSNLMIPPPPPADLPKVLVMGDEEKGVLEGEQLPMEGKEEAEVKEMTTETATGAHNDGSKVERSSKTCDKPLAGEEDKPTVKSSDGVSSNLPKAISAAPISKINPTLDDGVVSRKDCDASASSGKVDGNISVVQTDDSLGKANISLPVEYSVPKTINTCERKPQTVEEKTVEKALVSSNEKCNKTLKVKESNLSERPIQKGGQPESKESDKKALLKMDDLKSVKVTEVVSSGTNQDLVGENEVTLSSVVGKTMGLQKKSQESGQDVKSSEKVETKKSAVDILQSVEKVNVGATSGDNLSVDCAASVKAVEKSACPERDSSNVPNRPAERHISHDTVKSMTPETKPLPSNLTGEANKKPISTIEMSDTKDLSVGEEKKINDKHKENTNPLKAANEEGEVKEKTHLMESMKGPDEVSFCKNSTEPDIMKKSKGSHPNEHESMPVDMLKVEAERKSESVNAEGQNKSSDKKLCDDLQQLGIKPNSDKITSVNSGDSTVKIDQSTRVQNKNEAYKGVEKLGNVDNNPSLTTLEGLMVSEKPVRPPEGVSLTVDKDKGDDTSCKNIVDLKTVVPADKRTSDNKVIGQNLPVFSGKSSNLVKSNEKTSDKNVGERTDNASALGNMHSNKKSEICDSVPGKLKEGLSCSPTSESEKAFQVSPVLKPITDENIRLLPVSKETIDLKPLGIKPVSGVISSVDEPTLKVVPLSTEKQAISSGDMALINQSTQVFKVAVDALCDKTNTGTNVSDKVLPKTASPKSIVVQKSIVAVTTSPSKSQIRPEENKSISTEFKTLKDGRKTPLLASESPLSVPSTQVRKETLSIENVVPKSLLPKEIEGKQTDKQLSKSSDTQSIDSVLTEGEITSNKLSTKNESDIGKDNPLHNLKEKECELNLMEGNNKCSNLEEKEVVTALENRTIPSLSASVPVFPLLPVSTSKDNTLEQSSLKNIPVTDKVEVNKASALKSSEGDDEKSSLKSVKPTKSIVQTKKENSHSMDKILSKDFSPVKTERSKIIPMSTPSLGKSELIKSHTDTLNNAESKKKCISDSMNDNKFSKDSLCDVVLVAKEDKKATGKSMSSGAVLADAESQNAEKLPKTEKSEEDGSNVGKTSKDAAESASKALETPLGSLQRMLNIDNIEKKETSLDHKTSDSVNTPSEGFINKDNKSTKDTNVEIDSSGGADAAKNIKGDITSDLINTITPLGNVKSPVHNITDMKAKPTDEFKSRDVKETLGSTSKTTQITITSSSIPEINEAHKISNIYEEKVKAFDDNSDKEKGKASISKEVCENKTLEAAADILMSLKKDIIEKSSKTGDELNINKPIVKDEVSVEQELKGLQTVSGFGTKVAPMRVECKTSGTHDAMVLPSISRLDTPVTALPLNDGSPDSTRFKRRDLKQPRGKSILGITEKLVVANQMRQQMQGNSDAVVKESTSPRKMPGLIEMGIAKASRRKNLVKEEQRILKKSKPSSTPESNDSGTIRNPNQAFVGQGLETSVAKPETTAGQVSVDALRNLEQPSDRLVSPELALSGKFSVKEEIGSSSDSCIIIDLSSKTTDVPKDTRIGGNVKDGSVNSSEKSGKISVERQELEKVSVCREIDSSVSSKTDVGLFDSKKEDDSFKYPRVKKTIGKDKVTLQDRNIQIGGPTTRTRGCFKPTSPSLTKPNPKIEDPMEKNFPTGLKVATKRDELSLEVEFMKNSVEVSTEPFPKVVDTETRRTDHTESSLSIRPVNSPGLPSSSKLLEVIRVAEEKGREIVKVNDVEVMREPVGPSNPSVSLLRKPSGSPMFSSVTVSTEGQRKDLLTSETKAISESVQAENTNKFPSGSTESWEFVAKVGEVELLRESPRAPPKATPPPMTITVESPAKKVGKEKSEASGRKPGRPPSMPPPSKTPDYPMPPLNMMEQAFLAHQNLRNHPLEVFVGISNRPGDGNLLDPRTQMSPLGMQMGSSGQWTIPSEAHSRPSSRPSGMETYLAGRSQSVGEQISSESDNEKRKRGTPKGRNPPCPRWGSQEADMLSVKVDGHPLGTWSPGDWRSMPSVHMWPHGYTGYGPPIRPRGSVEPRCSRSVSPPHSGKDTRGIEQIPEDLSSPPLPRGRRESPHSFRHPFVHPSTFSGTSNYSNVSTMSYPSPKGNSSSALNLARSSASATPPSDTAMNLTMCRQPPAIPTPPPVLSSPSPQPSPRQSSLPVNLVKSRSSSPKTPAQQAPQNVSDGRGAVLPGGIVVPNLPLIFGREYSLGSPNTPPSGRISHCSAEESRDVGENGVSQVVRCSSEPPREHLSDRSSRDSPNITAFVQAAIPPRSSATQTVPNYPTSRPSSAMSSAEQMSTTTTSRSTSTEPNLLPGGVVIPNLFGPAVLRPGEEQWITSGGEIMRPDLPPRSASAMSQYHTEESPSKQVMPIMPAPVPTVSTPPIPPPSTPPPPPPIIPQKTGPGRRGGRSETPPPDKYNFRVEEAHVVRSSDILPGGGHGGAGGKLFACDICSGVYRRAFSLKRHYLRAHINYCHLSERDLSNCGIVVGDKMAVHSGGSGRRPYVHTTMPRNVAKLPDDDDEPERGSGRRTLLRDLFRCHTCGVCFDEKKRLKAHLMEHQCGSNRPSLLRQHAATHHPIAPVITPKPTPTPRQQPSSPTPTVYICAYCDRRFSSAAVRRRHRKLHESSPGPHPCYLCETAEDVPEVARETPSFAHLEDLRSHMASIHKDVYHSCALCGERLPSILALEEHAEEHRSRRGAGDHSEEEEEDDDAELVRVAAAVAPSSQSSTPSEVIQSTTAAQGEEEEFRYTCGVCQKMFTNYVNMCRHRRLAHGAAQAKVTGKKTGVSSTGKSQVGGGDSESSSRSQSPVVVSQSSERVHRDLLDGEPSSSSSSSVPSPCPYPTSSTVSTNDPETIFYTRLAGNIRDNLLNYLDGKLNKQEISEKKMKDDDRKGVSNENVGDDDIRTEPSWEKYNFPKDFQQMSFWDISTQLVVRNNLKKANSAANIEPNPEQRPAFPETLALVENSKSGEIPLKVDEITVKQEAVVEGEWSGLSGEWVRPRSYICCVCASRFGDLWALEDHQLARHQNIWCTHLEVEDGAVVLPGSPKLSPGTANVAVSFLGDLLCRRPLGPRGALLSAPSVPPTLNNGMDSPSARCTKCSRVCPSLPDLHSHMLECGGDLAWAAWAGGSSPAASSRRNSRKWRPFGSRRRRQRGRRGLKRNIPSSPVKMHRARHRGTDSDSIQRMIANLPPKRATRRVIQFNEDEIKTRSQATIHSVSFPGNFVRVSGYKTPPGVKGAPPTVAKRGRPPKNPLPPTPLNIEGLALPSTSMAAMSSMGMSSPGTLPGGPNLQGVVVKKARGRPPGSKSKTNLSNLSNQDYSMKRRFGESSGDGYSPESDRYGLSKRSRLGTSPVNQHQNSSTTPNAPGEPYICKGCGAVFDNASSCERHGKKCVFRRQMPAVPSSDGIRVASSGNARPVHSCPHCGKNFTYATPMEKHVRICGSGNSGYSRGPPVHVRRATAPSVLGRPSKVEIEEDVKKDSEKSPAPSEEVEVPPVEPPQEPDMPHLQKEEPVASPPIKDDDIPVLTPVEPEDEAEEAQEIVEKDSEEVVKVDAVVHVEEPEELVTSSESTVVENDGDLAVKEESVIKPADETVVEIKEEEIDRETFEIQVEETPTVELERILAGCQMEEGPIPGESTPPVEVPVEEQDKEEVSEETAFRTSGKRTRGSNSFSGQVAKKNKVEEEIVEPAAEVEMPKKKGGKKSLGGVTRGKSPKGAKISRSGLKDEDEIEGADVEDRKEELVGEEVSVEEVEVKEERLEQLEKRVDVQEKEIEQPEKEEVKETTDRESPSVTAEKESMSGEKEEDKEEREETSANESRGKRGRRGKYSRSVTTTETLAKATPEKVESASPRQGKRKGASVERPSTPKTDEAAEAPTADKEPKVTRSVATSGPPKQIVEVSTAEPSKEETASSKKVDKKKEEAEESSKPKEEVVESITEEEVAIPTEVEEVDTKNDASQAQSEDMDAEGTPTDEKQEDDGGEDDDEDSKSEKDSKLRGIRGPKGKVSKKSHKKKKKQEMKREVENFWCNVCKMGYSSAFNLVKHGQSQKHKWNLRLEKEKEEAEGSSEKKSDSKDEGEKEAGDEEAKEDAKKVDGGKKGANKEEESKNDAAEVVSKEKPTEEEEKEDDPKNGENLKGGKTTTGKKKGSPEVKGKEEPLDVEKGKEDDKSEISDDSESEAAVSAKDDKAGKTKVKDKKGKDATVPDDKGSVKGKGKFQEQKHGKKTPEKKTAEKKSPEKKSSEKKSPEKKVAEKKVAEKKSPEKKQPEKKSQEKKSPDKKSQDKKAGEKGEKDAAERESKDAVLNPDDSISDAKVVESEYDSKDNDPEMEEPLVRLKEDRSKKVITPSAPAVESTVNADSSGVTSDSTSNQEGSKKSATKENTDGTLIGQGINERGAPGKEENQPAPAQEAEGNITKVSPEDSVAAAPESATVIEGTKNTCEAVQCGVWPETTVVSAPTQEFLQPPVPGPTGYNSIYEWESNQQPSTMLQPTQLQQPTQVQTQTQLQQTASQQANSGQHVHPAHQDSWGIYGGWEAPTVDHSPTPPSPGLWRYQPPPTPMPWADPQHSLSPILRVTSYSEDPPPLPVTHPSPPNPSLGSILDSVNRILAEDVPGFDSSRMHAATVPEEEFGGVGLFGEGSLAELQRAMGATDEEMAMLQQLGTGPLDFVYDNNVAPSNVNYGATEVHDQVGPLPNAELVDLDNQVASVTMVGDGPMEEAETTAMPPVAVEGTTGLLVGDGRGGKKKRCGPPPSKCKRFPPPTRGESNRGWRGGRRPLLAQTSLASAHLLISQYEKKEMVCPVCNRHFLGLAALETHVAWVHKVKDPKQHILEGENAGQSSGKKANPASNSLRELVVGRGASGVVVGGGVASSPTPSRRLPCFVCKELYSDVISLNHHIAQQHLRRRPGEGGIVPEMDGDLKSQMTSALGDLLGKALANMRSRSDANSPTAKSPGLPALGGKSPITSTFPKLNLLNKSLDLMSKISLAGESSMRKSYGGGPSSSESPTESINRLEPPAESPEVVMFRRDDGMDPTEWSSDGEDSAKGQEGETLQEDGEVPSFHHVCPFCGDRFQRLSSRNRHIMSSHRELNSAELLRLRRSFSHESSDFDELLGRGRKEEEGAGALPKDESADDAQETGRRHNHHPCPACQLSFLRHSQLEAHLKRAHNGSDSQLPDSSDSMMECPICRESMNHFLKLCKHVKAKHREWCINCFTTDMHHHLILRKESPEESMVIRKKFLVKMKAFPVLRVASPTPSSRSSEEESYMDPDPKGNYLCSVCGVNFKSPQGVIRHLNLEHNSNHLEGALPMQKIFPRSTSKEYRGRTGGGSGSDIKAKAEAALRELNLSQKLKLGAMATTKGLMGSKSTQSRKLSSSSSLASTSELGMDAQTSGILPRGVGRGRGSNRRGRGRRGGRVLASSDVEKSLFDVYEFEDDDDDLEDTPSRVGSADGSSRVGSECGDDDDEDDAVEDDGKSGVSIAGSIRGKRLSVDSSSSEAKYSCNTCGKGYKSLTAFWKHSKGVRGSCAGGGSSPRCLERSGSQESVTSGRTSKMGGRKGAKDEEDALSDVESEAGSGRVLRRLRGSTSGAGTSEVGSEGSKDEAPTVEAPSETPKRGEKGGRGGKGKKKAGGEEEKKPLFSGGETVRTYGGKRSAKQQAEDRKSRGGGGGDEGDGGSGGRRSMGASEAAFDALRGGGGPS